MLGDLPDQFGDFVPLILAARVIQGRNVPVGLVLNSVLVRHVLVAGSAFIMGGLRDEVLLGGRPVES